MASTLFVDETGAPTDPTDVNIRFHAPSATDYDAPVVNVGVGLYTAEWIVDEPGTWTVQAEGTGALAVVEEESFAVRKAVIV